MGVVSAEQATVPATAPSAPAVEPVDDDAPPLRGPVMMGQRWLDVAFLHWAVDPARIAPLLPPGVGPDVREGVTWVGLIPFRMVGAGVGRGPGVPWAGTFLETNVRFYTVDTTGRRGIVFASLDADRLVVVAGARAAFGLPYRWSRMAYDERVVAGRREVLYRTTPRRGPLSTLRSTLHGRTAPDGGRAGTRVHLAVAERDAPRHGDLEDYLTARWGLHVRHAGRDWYVPNTHGAWPLHAAEVLELDDSLLAGAGLPDLADRAPDSVAFSAGVRTRFGLPTSSRRPRR